MTIENKVNQASRGLSAVAELLVILDDLERSFKTNTVWIFNQFVVILCMHAYKSACIYAKFINSGLI